MDTTEFTEEDIQRAGMIADKLPELPRVEGAKHAFSELLREWSGAKVTVKNRTGKDIYDEFRQSMSEKFTTEA